MTYGTFSKLMPEDQVIYNHKIANKGVIIPDKLIKEWALQTRYMLSRELKKRNIGNTGALQRSLDSLVSGTADIQKITFSFLKYGTFVDMGVGRGRTLEDRRNEKFRIGIDKLLGYKVTRQRRNKFNKKSDFQWYSKSLYGAIHKGLPKILAEAYGVEAARLINFPNVYEMF